MKVVEGRAGISVVPPITKFLKQCKELTVTRSCLFNLCSNYS